MKRIMEFCKKEVVLCIAGLLAIASMLIVIPDKEYLTYPDYRVLALLFCLMAIMEGFKQTGLFGRLAGALLSKVKDFRQLYLVLVLLCFFSSMWITNDVALITFVPFSILVLKLAGLDKEMIPVIVMQTVAANLGSMLTPVGNPQNLYLYSLSGKGFGEFVIIMLPLTVISLILIVVVCFLHKNKVLDKAVLDNILATNRNNSDDRNTDSIEDKGVSEAERQSCNSNLGQNIVLAVLFALSLLSVARILPWQLLLAITVITCIVMTCVWKNELLLKKVDYNLLLTFVAFFVFIGNMERIEAVGNFISGVLEGYEMIIAFVCSQVISNVPAAILLSGFTTEYDKLLMGVNIGGLGTIIASLASLISYKMYAVECGDNAKCGSKGRYMGYFTVVNVIFAAILIVAAYLL